MKGITLIGMPGSGKSTIGKILAEKLGWNFIDLDILIKEKTGKTHAEILEEKGNQELLRLEDNLTFSLNLADAVFSPGGSIVYSALAMERLRKETIIIYLELSLSEIKSRLGDKIDGRGIVGLKEKGLEKLFKERDFLYRKYAQKVINCSGLSEKEILKAITG